MPVKTIAMPRDTNANGDIFGGWLLSQMDLAGGVAAGKVARGHAAAFRCGRAGDSILCVPRSPERTGRQLA